MGVPPSFFATISTLVLHSIVINVNGNTEPCPTKVIIGLTGETADPSGFAENSSYIFLPNLTWSRDEKTYGRRCDFQPYLSLCCLPGEVRLEGRCAKDNHTAREYVRSIDNDGVKKNVPVRNYYQLIYDPCTVSWMTSWILRDFSVFENGSIYVPNYGKELLSGFDRYCLLRKPESVEYLVKVCLPWIKKGYYEICCLTIAIIILVTILICYTLVPELRNLHGMILRAYLASHIGVYLNVLGTEFTTEIRDYAHLFGLFEITAHYCGCCCLFWLGVISFNMWRTFRCIRCIDSNTRKREKRKFIWYAVFAWGSPVVLFAIIFLTLNYVPYLRNETFGWTFKQSVYTVTVIAVLVCNAMLHTMTVFNIRQHKMDSAILIDGVNKHYEVDRQWFNLYWKLFAITGVHMTIWPIWLIWPTAPGLTNVMATLEVLQGVLIFLIFVWKDNVKRSLRQRFFSS